MNTKQAKSWQKRRSEFNHDWLKNQYIPALAKCLNLLDGRIEDVVFEAAFVTQIFPQWERHREEVVSLIQNYEAMMSPQRLMEEPPLSNTGVAVSGWLGPLVHFLWLARSPARKRCLDALEMFELVDASYKRLSASLASTPLPISFDNLRSLRKQFSDYRDSLLGLANVMSDFPREINVT